ncbi:MAG: PEGA domain-containing protein [Labilithrix sp.]|nr:PEGA domain-containing protein [Labilithrix sp.]
MAARARASFAFLLVSLLLSWAPAARAQDAAALKSQGDAFMDAERYAEAAQTYAKAYAASSDPALLYNEGRALEALGEYPEAIKRLEQFRSLATPALRARATGLEEHIEALKGRVSTLVVISNVRGAQLLVRSKNEGKLEPTLEISVRSGPATIEVTADGHEPYKQDVVLAPRKTTTLDVRLREKNVHGLLVVTAKPEGSDVIVDGKGFGRTPLEARLAPGSHSVVISKSGHEDERLDVVLQSGERKELDLTLAERSAITSRWWFWTGIAAIVAGAAIVTTVALTSGTETKPPLGGEHFSPGQIPTGFRF